MRSALAEGMRRIEAHCEMPEQLSRLPLAVATLLAPKDADALPLLGVAVDAATADLLLRLEEVAKHHIHVVDFDMALASIAILDDQNWDEVTRSWVQLHRAVREHSPHSHPLGLRSWLHTIQGRVGAADSAPAEAEDLAALIGVRGLPTGVDARSRAGVALCESARRERLPRDGDDRACRSRRVRDPLRRLRARAGGGAAPGRPGLCAVDAVGPHTARSVPDDACDWR